MIRRTAIAALIYLVAACAFTWPLVLHPHALLGAMDPTGDPSLYLWTLGWDLHTLTTHPSWLVTGRVFNAGIFLPAPLTLAYSDHLLLQAVALWPVYAVTHDLIFCYNLLLIGSLVASALAMHVLARSLTGSEAAASVAGLIFGFAPYHFTHLLHIQLQALYFLPLSFFFLHRLFTGDRRSDTVGLGVVTALQTLSSVYYGVIGAIGLACAAVVQIAATGRITDWRLIRRGVAAALLALLIAAPWSIPYLRVARDIGGGRTLYEASNGSAVWSSYLQAPETNLAVRTHRPAAAREPCTVTVQGRPGAGALPRIHGDAPCGRRRVGGTEGIERGSRSCTPSSPWSVSCCRSDRTASARCTRRCTGRSSGCPPSARRHASRS